MKGTLLDFDPTGKLGLSPREASPGASWDWPSPSRVRAKVKVRIGKR